LILSIVHSQHRGQSSHSEEENIAKVVGAALSRGFVVDCSVFWLARLLKKWWMNSMTWQKEVVVGRETRNKQIFWQLWVKMFK